MLPGSRDRRLSGPGPTRPSRARGHGVTSCPREAGSGPPRSSSGSPEPSRLQLAPRPGPAPPRATREAPARESAGSEEPGARPTSPERPHARAPGEENAEPGSRHQNRAARRAGPSAPRRLLVNWVFAPSRAQGAGLKRFPRGALDGAPRGTNYSAVQRQEVESSVLVKLTMGLGFGDRLVSYPLLALQDDLVGLDQVLG